MRNILQESIERAIYGGYVNYLEYDKFTDRVELGIGRNLGSVFKSEWKDCYLTVALKSLNVDTSPNEEIIKNFINGLKLLRKVDCHPNIISFYGITRDYNGSFNMVYQYANEGNLREYLKKNFTILQWANKLHIAREISLGLLFLHDNDIIHENLHPKNILIHQGRPMITDFEMSNTVCSMPAYIDPQCFNSQNYKCNKKSDIYSFGIILWEISSGIPPFQFFASEYLLALHISRGNREVPTEGTPFQYVNLYKQCWKENPEIRPETNAVFETLDNFIPDENLNQHLPNEPTFSNQQGNSNININTRYNPHETYEIASSSLDNQNIRVNKGKGKEVIRETYEIASSSLDNMNMRVDKGKGKEVIRETHEVTSFSSVSENTRAVKRACSPENWNIHSKKRKDAPHETHEIIASSSVSANTRANKRKETASSSVSANQRKETASSSVSGNKRANMTISSFSHRSIRANKRNDAHECFKKGKFLKALKFYEEIFQFKDSRRAANYHKLASKWEISRRCSPEEIND
ncbi:kinase-like protein [Gigaspora margarita]|uniref:Kinase-like protein n=1 Tax=Gigaspora margarita TaxID=4874 RepID=A0A8H3WW88_GIGMA|nr:kinase-like protein [Gigaspora margarita]